MIPIASLIERYDKEKTFTSEYLQEQMDAMSKDIILGYSNIEESNDNINLATQLNSIEMNLVSNYISDLEDKLDALEKLVNSTNSFLNKNYYNNNSINIIKGDYNPQYGYISCPIKHTAKLDFFHYPIDFLIKNLNIELNVYKDTENKELIRTENLNTNTNLINIVNNNSNDYFITNDILPITDTNSLIYELTISLPSGILSSLAINNIIINPVPLYSLTLRSVEYMSKTGNYETIKELSNKYNLKNEFVIIDTILSNQLRFTFEQPSYTINNGRKEFIFGLREIFINSLSYTSNECIWISEYNLDDVYFKNIHSCSLKTNNSLAYEKHELFLDKDLTKQALFDQDLSEPVKTIYIKHTIGSYTDHLSIITGEEIEFSITSEIATLF